MMNVVSAEDVCNVLSILWEHFRAEDGALRHAEQQRGIIWRSSAEVHCLVTVIEKHVKPTESFAGDAETSIENFEQYRVVDSIESSR